MMPLCRIFNSTRIAISSSLFLMQPITVMAYKQIDSVKFAREQSPEILRNLGANESLLKVHKVTTNIMADIMKSEMVQGMAKGTLTKEEWNQKYMCADVLYIYRLGNALVKKAQKTSEEQDRINMMELAEMFLGYGKHFERLKKYGLSPHDTLISPECDAHISLLTEEISMHEYYIAICTDMIPYVVFANYLLNSIEKSDNNPWFEYANKYGNLNNKYAKERLGKIIKIANEILKKNIVDSGTAEDLFLKGFKFEEWFIRNAFCQGFDIRKRNTD